METSEDPRPAGGLFREDLCFEAGEAIQDGMGKAMTPIDPRRG